jgi:hypothetical protein
VCRFTKTQRLFEDRIEDRFKLTGQGIDDLQHFGCGRLAGQRLVALGRRLIQVPLRLVPLGSALGKFSLTLSKLTLQIGDELLEVG